MKSPKMPAAPAAPLPPPAPPSVDQAVQSIDQNNLLRQRRGRAATLLAGDSTGPANTGVKQYLG